MQNSSKDPAIVIVLTSPDGEHETIEIPHPPKPTLLERLRWQLHCWRTDVRNGLYWLRGGRW